MRQNRAGSWEAAQKDINIEPGMMMEGTVPSSQVITELLLSLYMCATASVLLYKEHFC
jgi:hypothetical protein